MMKIYYLNFNLSYRNKALAYPNTLFIAYIVNFF